jgi:uncharacterized protein YjbJ (UPF0337 family)
MKKPGRWNTTNRVVKIGDQSHKSKTGAITAPFSPLSAKPVINAPVMLAAASDLAHKAQQALPSADEVAGKWKQQIGAAKIAWGKLTDDELLTIEGHAQKLAGLIQERYAITRDEAEAQVKSFFEKYAS